MLKGDTIMSSHHRDIEILLMDYADALRDGSIPTFLKSLSRKEAQLIRRSIEFPEALAMARLLNEVHFSDRAMHPDIGLFTSGGCGNRCTCQACPGSAQAQIAAYAGIPVVEQCK